MPPKSPALLGLRFSEVFCQKGVLKNFPKFTGKHLCPDLFFIKVAGSAGNFIKKETLAQVFSCKFYEISKKTFFYWTPRVAVSEWHSLKSGPENQDLGHWDLRPGTLRPRILGAETLGLWDSGTRDPDTQDPRTGTLGHGTLEIGLWELEIATLRLIIHRAGPWELNLWSRF